MAISPQTSQTIQYDALGNQLPANAPAGSGVNPLGMTQAKTLIEIAQSRPDVLNMAKSLGGDPFAAGTAANTWLNNWWNTNGKSEFPNTILKQPLAELNAATKNAQSAVDGLGLSGNINLNERSNQEIDQNGKANSPDTASISATAEGLVTSTPTQEALQKEITRLEKERAASESSLKSLIGNAPKTLSSEELMKQAFTNLGLPADFTKAQFQQMQTTAKEIETLNLSLNAVNKREETSLLNIEGQPITMGSINAQSIQAKKYYAIEKASVAADIAIKSAFLEAVRGNFTLVTNLVDKAVNYAFQDQQQKIDDYRWMYSNYKEEMNNLSTKEQNLFTSLLTSIENETEAQKQDLKDKINMYLNAGLSIPDTASLKTMTIEEVAKTVSQKQVKNEWGETYTLGGDIVQKNLKTGEI